MTSLQVFLGTHVRVCSVKVSLWYGITVATAAAWLDVCGPRCAARGRVCAVIVLSFTARSSSSSSLSAENDAPCRLWSGA